MPKLKRIKLSPSDPENVIFVVLHGFISLIDIGGTDDAFLAYLLDMGDAHAYLYGNWLFEDEFPLRAPGQLPLELGLQGVDPFPKSELNILNTSVNVVVKVSSIPALPNAAIRGIIHLPRPRAIYYAISGDIQKDSLKGTKADIDKIVGTPTEVSGIKIFEYTCPDIRNVQLVHFTDDPNPLWHTPKEGEGNPAKFDNPNRQVFTLHIYDEPPTTMKEEEAQQHTVDEFNMSLNVLGVAVQMTKNAGDLELPDKPPTGLASEELCTLDCRRANAIALFNRGRGGKDDKSGAGTGGQVCSGAHGILPGGMARQRVRLRGVGDYGKYFRQD
jgi:hypothetical protein